MIMMEDVLDQPHPANTIQKNNVVLMLGQRRRRWANGKTILFLCIVHAD